MLDIVREYGPLLVTGLLTTARMALIAFALAFLVGLLIAACRVSPVPPLARAATLYVTFFRNIPLAVLMILVFFVLPDLELGLSGFWSAVLALSLYSGAYLAEIIRSGINTVAAGEVEAARAVGLTFTQVLGLIVLPQALRSVVAPIGSLFIAHTKNTTVAALISAGELGDFTRRAGSASANYFTVALLVSIVFVAILVPTGSLFGALERRVAIKR